MVTKFSRIVFIFTIIFVLSIVIPEYYWMIFEKHHAAPSVIYSSLLKDFIKFERRDNKVFRFDNKGNNILKKKFEELAPLYYYRTLSYLGTMPEKIDTYKVNLRNLKLNSIFFQIKPNEILMPQIQLFPLIEAVPNGPKLDMPNDFFRINDKMEFINCETNEIIPELTEKFTAALIEVGFEFPAKKIFGNPTVMKPFDEGYFILDSKSRLFHVKRVRNNPYVKRIDLPEEIVPAFIQVTEMELREFYALLISEKSDVYLISYDNYKLIKLPVKDFDYRKNRFRFQGNPLYRIITISSATSISVFVTDRNYNLVNEYRETWESKYDRPTGKIFSAVFPFSLDLTDSKTSYVGFYFHFSGWLSIVGAIISLLIYLFVQIKKKEEASRCKFDYVIIAFTGIYGLIAALLIRDETWKI